MMHPVIASPADPPTLEHRPSPLRRWTACGATLLIALVGLVLTGCAGDDEAANAADTGRPIAPGAAVTESADPNADYATVTVEQRDLVRYRLLEGQAVAPPNAYAAITAPFSAPVSEVYATLGAAVQEGDVLFELEYPSAEALYQDARAEVRQARAALQTAEARLNRRVTQAEAAVRNAEADLRAAEQAYQSLDSEADARVLMRREAELQQAQTAVLLAEQDLNAAEVAVDAALVPYQRQLALAEEALAEAQEGRKAAMVRTPIDGQLIDFAVRPDDVIYDASRVVARVADLSALSAHVPLAAGDETLLREGQTVDLSFNALPDAVYEATVEQITSDYDEDERRRRVAVLTFDNEDGLVKPNMEAEIILAVERLKDALVVPNAALVETDEGSPAVLVDRGDDGELVPVQTLMTNGLFTAIDGDVKAGQTLRVPLRDEET